MVPTDDTVSSDAMRELESYLAFLADHDLEEVYEAEPLNRTLAENKPHFPRAVAAGSQIPVTGVAAMPQIGGPTGGLRPQSLANFDLGAALHEAKGRVAQARTLDELYSEIDAFQTMPMRHEGAKSLVRFRGTETPKLLVIGEIPDAEEYASGIAFAGRPGALIDKALKAAGVLDVAMLAPCVFWRPAGGRPLTPEDTSLNAPFLHAFIRLAAPQGILLLGASAVTSVLNLDQSLSKLRGRPVSYTDGGNS
ncbi:MAG: uracil-DNA glycosylase, partial [Asticcacaulis sp.]|nr:uracil-DNA glycosylase [Asticcacaulis sp.]